MAWLGHPLTVLALLLLILNDHVLKAAYPGWLTGKLSDAAGLVVAPPVLATLLSLAAPRRRVAAAAVVAVGLGFTLTKAVPYGGQVASTVWSVVAGPSVIRADWTDLIALPFLVLAWWSWRSTARRPVPVRWARAVRVAVLLPAALIGVAATAAPHYPSATVVATDGDRFVAVEHNDYHRSAPPGVGRWLVSDDGGGTWVDASPADQYRYETTLRDGGRSQGCVDRLCLRVVPGRLRVEESTDGGRTWSTGWALSDRQREVLLRRYEAVGDPARHLSSVAVALLPRPGGGVAALVANGRDGFVVRHPDGRWERIGFVSGAPSVVPLDDLSLVERGRDGDVVIGALLAIALAAGVVGLGSARIRARRGRGPDWWLLANAVSAVPVMLLLLWFAAPRDTLLVTPLWLVAPAGVVIAAAAVAVQTVFTARLAGVPAARWWGAVGSAGLLTAALVTVVTALWLSVVVTSVGLACGLYLAAAGPGVWLVCRYPTLRRRTRPSPSPWLPSAPR